MQSPQRKIRDIDRLLSAFPAAVSADPEQTLRNYLLAVEDWHADDVEAAVTNFIKGNAPGVRLNFLPSPAEVGGECRRVLNLRLRAEALERRPALPPPDVVRTPESMARVRAMTAEIVERLASQVRTDDASKAHERKRWQDRVDSRWMPDQSDEALRARLHIEVGDSDGEAEVA